MIHHLSDITQSDIFDIISVLVGILGVLLPCVTWIATNARRRIVRRRNEKSEQKLVRYDPEEDNVLPLRQWNTRGQLTEDMTSIVYDATRVIDAQKPRIDYCDLISNQNRWLEIYASEYSKEKKRSGAVSYLTHLSIDHNDTPLGRQLELTVSTCDYLSHHVNAIYFKEHPEDWDKIKQILANGNLNEYFDKALPGNVFVNMIVINATTNNMLLVKRSSSELNARNVWCIGGFETMNDIANASNGSEELTLHGITYRGLREEFYLQKDEITSVSISSISFVKHLGLMVTALVRIDLGGPVESSPKGVGISLTEGALIERVLNFADSAYEHRELKWVPIKLDAMKQYIQFSTGYYQRVIAENHQKDNRWISYVKWEMYEIWRNHFSIGIIL